MLDRKSGILVCVVAIQLMTFKGCFSANETEGVTEEPSQIENTTLAPLLEETATEFPKTFQPVSVNRTSFNQTPEEVIKIATNPKELFSVNETLIRQNCMNLNSVNLTCLQEELNDTLGTNHLNMAETVGPSEGFPAYGLQNTAAIAAGVFLISAVAGYLSCVGYRHFLQRKYGNSQILIVEEVYDTTDLKYVEI